MLRKKSVVECPMVAAAKILGTVWSIVVISYLLSGPKGFNELLRMIPDINSKTLSRTLKALQKKGLVTRTVVSLQPFAVTYSATPMAYDLDPILQGLRNWSLKWISNHGSDDGDDQCSRKRSTVGNAGGGI